MAHRAGTLAHLLFFCLFSIVWAEDLDPRVINGNDASSCPYQARVQITLGSSAEFCGGVVLTASYVLTAAHCCDSADQKGQTVENTYVVTAGTLKRTSGGTSRTADRVYIHPLWDSSTYASEQGWDICLLHLSSPFPLSDTIATISIASSNPSAGSLVRLTGWGSIIAYAEGSPSTTQLADNLQEAYLTVLSESTVDNWFTTQGGVFGCHAAADVATSYNFTGIIATGNNEGTVYDACQGDSGGPIAMKNSDGSFSLVGAVSHGYGCGQSGIPSFQASVVASRQWVELVISGVSGISTCSGRTCGTGAQCSSGSCVCASGYSYAMGYSHYLGYTCKRWLNGGTLQQVSSRVYALYQLVPSTSAWDSSIIRGFGSPPIVSSLVTSCGYNFYPRNGSEASDVVSQVTSYSSSASLGSAPNNAIWTAIGKSGTSYKIFLEPSTTLTLSTSLWASGEPNGGDCVMMGVSGSTTALLDAVSCDNQMWYIVRYTTSTNVVSGTASSSTTSDGQPLAPFSIWLLLFALGAVGWHIQ